MRWCVSIRMGRRTCRGRAGDRLRQPRVHAGQSGLPDPLFASSRTRCCRKVGIVKIWWEKQELKERETYLDLDEAAFAAIVRRTISRSSSIIEHSAQSIAQTASPSSKRCTT